MDSTIAKIKAAKKPVVLKPFMKWSTNKTISTVMINDIKPKLKILIGKVKSRSIVPMVALAKAIRIPAMMALKNPSTCTPGTRKAATDTAMPVSNSSIINLI